MELSDEDLYGRIRKGDPCALEQLYERREPALYRYGLQLSGNRAVAEEATHDAFLQLIRPECRFDAGRGSIEAYLYGTVRNLIRTVRRREAPEAPDEPACGDDILRALMNDEMAGALHSALQQLPAAFRDAVFLCDLEERSYEEAAKALDCPVGTIRSRLHRARQMLAAKLEPFRLASGKAVR